VTTHRQIGDFATGKRSSQFHMNREEGSRDGKIHWDKGQTTKGMAPGVRVGKRGTGLIGMVAMGTF